MATPVPLPLRLALAVTVLWAGAGPAPAAGQARGPDTRFSLDLEWLGATVGHARRLEGGGGYRGVEAGVGGSLWTLVAERAGAEDLEAGGSPRRLVELVHVGAFRRWGRGEGISLDLGARASAFVREGGAEEQGIPLFAGGYAAVLLGSRWLKAGPRLQAGVLAGGGRGPEAVLVLAPLTVRVSTAW